MCESSKEMALASSNNLTSTCNLYTISDLVKKEKSCLVVFKQTNIQ